MPEQLDGALMLGTLDDDQEEEKKAEVDLVTDYERIDQGFFRNLITKFGRAELSHSRWNIGSARAELKKCAFTDDEHSIMVVTQTGSSYRMPIELGEQPAMQPQSLLGGVAKRKNTI